jgi:Na+/glutamate symporter
MTDLGPLIVAAKVVAFGVGLLVTHLAYRASRRTGSVSLRTLAFGAGVITLSAVVGGGLDQFVGVDLEVGVLLSSVLLLVGFAALAYSLYVSDPSLSGDELPPSDSGTGN